MGSYGSQSVESIHNLLAREAQMHAETRCQALQEAENMRHPYSNDLVEQLRQRACPPEGEYLEHDHGHSDCYLEREAADEIERLRSLITAWADADDAVSRDDYVNTLRAREQARDAPRKAVGR